MIDIRGIEELFIGDYAFMNATDVRIEIEWTEKPVKKNTCEIGRFCFKKLQSFFLSSNNLQSFQTGDYSFNETRSLYLSGNSIQFYFRLYLPNLQSFQTGNQSFYQTTSFSLSSNSIQILL